MRASRLFNKWLRPAAGTIAVGGIFTIGSMPLAHASGLTPSSPPSSFTSTIHSLPPTQHKPATPGDLRYFRVNGLCAAVFTPLKPNGDINPSVIASLVAELERGNVKSVFGALRQSNVVPLLVNYPSYIVAACGTSGENRSLSVKERKILMEEWVKQCHRVGIQVVAQIGAESLEDTKALAKHAQEIDADAIAALPPSYYKPSSISALIDVSKF